MRRLLLALAGLTLAVAPSYATNLYLVEGEAPRGLDRVLDRQVPGLHLLITPEGRVPLSEAGLKKLDVPTGSEAFLVQLREDVELAALKHHTQVLAVGDGFAVVAADRAQHRNLDLLRTRKERLTWIEPVRRSGRPWEIDRPVGKVDAATKANIVASVDEFHFGILVRELSGGLVFWLDGELTSTNNRYTHDPGHLIAADYLEERFNALGLNTYRQNFMVGGTPTQNIVAELVGTTYPDEIVVVGGHYDSTSENTASSAPGAEDNASGTAGVLHLAEIFSQYETERTIHFVAFGGEEQGLFGSQEYVSLAAANGDNVTEALTLDMISYWGTNFKVIIEGEHAWEPLMSLFESNVQDQANIGYRKDYNSFGSDHVPFQNANIPAFLAIEWDYPFYPDYHKTTDTWTKLDFELGWRIVRAMAGSLADLTNPTDPTTDVPGVKLHASLDQNSPNPFNPQTTIAFTTGVAGPVNLAIYDVSGRYVASLMDEHLEPGDHSVVWNGRDTAGDAVSSGVYVYRLTTGETTLSRRMVLVK